MHHTPSIKVGIDLPLSGCMVRKKKEEVQHVMLNKSLEQGLNLSGS